MNYLVPETSTNQNGWKSVGWWTKPLRLANGWKSPFPSIVKWLFRVPGKSCSIPNPIFFVKCVIQKLWALKADFSSRPFTAGLGIPPRLWWFRIRDVPPQKYQQKMHIFCGYFFKGKIGPRMSNVWIGMINEAILPILNDKAKPFQKI